MHRQWHDDQALPELRLDLHRPRRRSPLLFRPLQAGRPPSAPGARCYGRGRPGGSAGHSHLIDPGPIRVPRAPCERGPTVPGRHRHEQALHPPGCVSLRNVRLGGRSPDLLARDVDYGTTRGEVDMDTLRGRRPCPIEKTPPRPHNPYLCQRQRGRATLPRRFEAGPRAVCPSSLSAPLHTRFSMLPRDNRPVISAGGLFARADWRYVHSAHCPTGRGKSEES